MHTHTHTHTHIHTLTGKGVLVGDAFKTVIGKLEEDMPMEAKEVCGCVGVGVYVCLDLVRVHADVYVCLDP